MAKVAKFLILVELVSSKNQCCDLLGYLATSDLTEDDYMTVYTAVINKMRTF